MIAGTLSSVLSTNSNIADEIQEGVIFGVRSVALGGGRFVNRVPDLGDPETRRVNGKAYPEGDSCARSVISGASEDNRVLGFGSD